MICKYCKHQNQENAIFCENCGKKLNGGGNNKKILCLAVLAVVIAVGAIFLTKSCNHEWTEATCDAPKTCIKCGETKGETLSHTWIDADCTTAKNCVRCKETVGLPLGHTWISATCTEAKTCSVCGRVEGTPSNHNWIGATCTSPMYCEDCHTVSGEVAEHEWIPAVDLSGVEGLICVNCQETWMPTDNWVPLTACEKISASNETAHFADIVVDNWDTRAGKLPDSLRFCVSGKENYKRVHYINYKLGGNFNYLSGLCYFGEQSDQYATAKFEVYLDNKLVFESNVLSSMELNQSFTVDVTGVDVVRVVCSTQDEHTAYSVLSASVY